MLPGVTRLGTRVVIAVAAVATLLAGCVVALARHDRASGARPAPHTVATTPPPATPSATAADIDGDGAPDPVAIAASPGRWGVVAHLSRLGDRYAWQPGAATGRQLTGVTDMNRDGTPEIVVRTASDTAGQSYLIAALVHGALVWARGAGRTRPRTFHERAGPLPFGWGCIDWSSGYTDGDVYQAALDLTEAPVRAYGALDLFTLRDGILTYVYTWNTFWHPRTEQPPREYTGGLGCGL
jgi:hypothetical protein